MLRCSTPGHQGPQPQPLGPGRQVGQGGVGLQHRIPGPPDLGDLAEVVHDPQGPETGRLGRGRRWRSASRPSARRSRSWKPPGRRPGRWPGISARSNRRPASPGGALPMGPAGPVRGRGSPRRSPPRPAVSWSCATVEAACRARSSAPDGAAPGCGRGRPRPGCRTRRRRRPRRPRPRPDGGPPAAAGPTRGCPPRLSGPWPVGSRSAGRAGRRPRSRPSDRLGRCRTRDRK